MVAVLVDPDFTTVAKDPVVDTKYWYHEIPARSVHMDRVRLNAPLAVDQLHGLVRVGAGATVSRTMDLVKVNLSVPVWIVIYTVLVPSPVVSVRFHVVIG